MNVNSITKADVAKTAADMKNQGYRLVVVTCTPAAEGYDITYSYDKEGELKHYRINVSESDKIDSIGKSYGGAFVYENEIHDLYGFTFEGMTLDFKGTFIRTSIPFPFKKQAAEPTVTKVKKEEQK
ncbi:MAG: NADH-quinone oxidoreductase subunit C [Methanocorpusculum sp.]|nr:NADH-quinone oxidoreductase subunit C [Methanocorpusculum sp.]